MADKLHGFPYWLLTFDKDGKLTDAAARDRLVSELNAQKISDLFIFSHGWNNDRAAALSLYDRFFGAVRKIVDDNGLTKKNPAAQIGVVGVLWPSILWPDDAASASMSTVVGGGTGAVSAAGAPPAKRAQATPQQINTELKKGYDDAQQRSLIDELTGMLAKQTGTEAALKEFQTKLAALLDTERASPLDKKQPDSAESAIGKLSAKKWHDLLDVLGAQALRGQTTGGGAVGIADPFKKLWEGAKNALRVGTYWQMKERAGVVGQTGLGGVLTQIAAGAKNTHVHLLGHSFGARLVSFSLAGLPAQATGAQSPVKSLFLLQGAFSHWAFADKLPHDVTRAGALKGMAARVDGPLLTTHSLKDLAVGNSYPAASFANGDDSAAASDQVSRWGAMGHDGAQAVKAATELLAAPGKKYSFRKGEWLNLDGNGVIIHGGLPSGAHSDIVHPHTAWAALAAAGIV